MSERFVLTERPAIYLASKSPRRQELLRQIGVEFEELLLREAPGRRRDIVEAPHQAEPPLEYVKRIARTEGVGRLASHGPPRPAAETRARRRYRGGARRRGLGQAGRCRRRNRDARRAVGANARGHHGGRGALADATRCCHVDIARHLPHDRARTRSSATSPPASRSTRPAPMRSRARRPRSCSTSRAATRASWACRCSKPPRS